MVFENYITLFLILDIAILNHEKDEEVYNYLKQCQMKKEVATDRFMERFKYEELEKT